MNKKSRLFKSNTKTMKGVFRPNNPEKYKGNPTNIVYLSSWELKFMIDLDKNPDVISWSSEEQPVSYKNPVTGRLCRYYPDFWMKWKDKKGVIKEAVVELKPFNQTVQPVQGTQKKATFAKQVMTYAVNQAKWEAARHYCEKKQMQFLLLTENELGVK